MSERVKTSELQLGDVILLDHLSGSDSGRQTVGFLVTRLYSKVESRGGQSCDCFSANCHHVHSQTVDRVEVRRIFENFDWSGETHVFARAVKGDVDKFASKRVIHEVTKIGTASLAVKLN